MKRTYVWMVRLTMLGAGCMVFQTMSCSEETKSLVAQGVSGLLTSILNNLIAVGVSELFGLQSTGTF